MIAFRRSVIGGALGIALLAAPHIIGAPMAEAGEGPVPAVLTHKFIAVATITLLPCWALLGALTGEFYRRFSRAG
jgi:predicted cobalt transporter CbtA